MKGLPAWFGRPELRLQERLHPREKRPRKGMRAAVKGHFLVLF